MSGPVLVTGAAGRIGTVLRGGLPERGWAVRCLDVVPVVDVRPGEEHLVADATDLGAMLEAAEGASAVVHLAGMAGGGTGPGVLGSHNGSSVCPLVARPRARAA